MTATRTFDTRHQSIASTYTRRPSGEMQALSFAASDLLAFLTATIVAATITGMLEGLETGSLLTRWLDRARAYESEWHGWGVLLILVVTLAQLRGRGHYSQRVPFWTMARDLVSVGLIAFFCDLILSVKIYNVPFEAEQALRWVLFVALILAFRSVTINLLTRAGLWNLRTLVIGPEHALPRVAHALQSEPGLGFSIVGSTAHPFTSGLDGLSHFLDRSRGRRIDYVALVADPTDADATGRIVAALNRARVPFAMIHAVSTLPVRMARPQYFMSHDIVVMPAGGVLASSLKQIAKRGFDLAVASFLVILLSPLLLAITIMVRRGGGPALYRHRRVGYEGQSFGCIKFRSMDIDSDRLLSELLARDPAAAAEWAATQKLRFDPRITPIGRFLRNTSLDELPQLLNVLRGEMSLVGPRPIVQAELGFYGESAEFYTQARPGLTGLWQVSGRSDTTYEQRVRLDVWYVRNWSLWHDLAILMKTIPVVLFRRGAV